MRVFVLCLVGFSALTMAYTLPKDDNNFGVGRRTKRGIVKESGELIGKVGKFGARWWRIFKVKRYLLNDAQLIKVVHGPSAPVRGKYYYTKVGGMRRAEADFKLSSPNNVCTLENGKGGEIENYLIFIRYGVPDARSQFILDCCKNGKGRDVVGAISFGPKKTTQEMPVVIYYLK